MDPSESGRVGSVTISRLSASTQWSGSCGRPPALAVANKQATAPAGLSDTVTLSRICVERAPPSRLAAGVYEACAPVPIRHSDEPGASLQSGGRLAWPAVAPGRGAAAVTPHGASSVVPPGIVHASHT